MKFTIITTIAVLFMLNTYVLAQGENWICTCFNPSYDRGCCNEVGYTMMVDGNVCDIKRSDVASKDKFRTCCDGIEGKTKCK